MIVLRDIHKQTSLRKRPKSSAKTQGVLDSRGEESLCDIRVRPMSGEGGFLTVPTKFLKDPPPAITTALRNTERLTDILHIPAVTP